MSLKTPLLICLPEPDGRVIFKNTSARQLICRPSCGACFRAHINRSHLRTWHNLCATARPCILDMTEDSVFQRALAFHYHDYIAVIFPVALQQTLLSSFVKNLSLEVNALAASFTRLLDSVLRNLSVNAPDNTSLSHFDDVISLSSELTELLYGKFYENNNRVEFFLYDALEHARAHVCDMLAKCGCVCDFDHSTISKSLIMCDFGRVMTSLFSVLSLIISLSSDKVLAAKSYTTVRITKERERLTLFVFECSFTLPQHHAASLDDCSDEISLSREQCLELFSAHAMEFIILFELAEYRNWTFDFILRRRDDNNAVIRISMDVGYDDIVYGAPSADPARYDKNVAEYIEICAGRFFARMEEKP